MNVFKRTYKLLLLSMLLLIPIFESAAQSRYHEEKRAAEEKYRQRQNAAAEKYHKEKQAAAERYFRERNAAIERYQKVFASSLGRQYSHEKDTTDTKTLVESALLDDVKPENLVKSVKVLEEGVKKGANVDDALDVARLVQQENTNVSAEQTAAFSQARQIAEERNVDQGTVDAALYDALRKDATPAQIVEVAKTIESPPEPPKAPVAIAHGASWEPAMKSAIQEFFTARTPYVWGGNSIHGVDCSGFTTLVLYASGVSDIKNYRQSRLQFDRYRINNVNPKNAKLGDLIFFYSNKNKGRIDHVGLVENINEFGDVVFVHSSRGKKGIGRDILTDGSYWGVNFAGIKRVKR